jgi:membrane fusion protein (multidrug efflux system)
MDEAQRTGAVAKRMVIMLLAVALVLGGVFGYLGFKQHMMKQFMAQAGNQPQTVSTTTAHFEDWQPRLAAVGGLRASAGAEISPEVAGTIGAIHFVQGQDVERGRVLVELVAADDIAKLHALQAAAELAQTTYARDQEQFQFKAVSQQVLDADHAGVMQARAAVEQQQALINKKHIHALFAGRVGIRMVSVGQYVAAGTPVVSLQALDPIYLDFSVPQQHITQVHVGQEVSATTDAFPHESFAGKVAVINPEVDPATLNVRVRVELKNPQRLLLPGMYATVDITTGEAQRYITLPQTAITYNPYGSIVYLAQKDGTDQQGKPKLIARQVFVTTGDTRGDQVAVLSGVKDGDTVVTAGQIKLHNGSPIAVNNDIQPSNEPHPLPQDQ